ncbi:glycogen debranching enzyme [Arthrobacter sp. PvP102]|uniref:glycogen debranching N-terminal domain-containing protein n=1 Tax=unclassified Arthrobacter TaxID=235627 RepID=UPI001B5290AA|nr:MULTISPECIES: glycogen debranching N-terminal domain-containing protein [unclassified Arthrobacter]MBP1235406.1 glycogen debranching enzyme [Arthrobacter sp. PvP103]MBP1236365.1 glycogen debranching enzyme [Arthrobacter sp. PvP102]
MPGWNVHDSAVRGGTGEVTLVQGTSFCVSSANGDMSASKPQGVFFEDTRYLSEWKLTVNGLPLEALSAATPEPFHAVFMGRTLRHDHADSSVLVERDRQLGANLTETITVHNYAREPFHCRLEVLADADFADLFEVKECRQAHRISRVRHATRERLTVESERPGDKRSITVVLTGARIEGRRLLVAMIIPSHTAWSVTVSAAPDLQGEVGRGGGLRGHQPVFWFASTDSAPLVVLLSIWSPAMARGLAVSILLVGLVVPIRYAIRVAAHPRYRKGPRRVR